MQTLQTLVHNLAIILLLATFLEMLLPNKSMRGFVQMVMGLFVISAVLAPITTLLHTPLTMEIPAWTATTNQDIPAIATEGQAIEIGRDAVQEQYRQILEHQIEALALDTKGVEAVVVDVKFEEGAGGVTDQPKIALITITLSAAKGDIQPVQPIIVGQTLPTSKTQPTVRAEEVRNKISALMSLPIEKILVLES